MRRLNLLDAGALRTQPHRDAPRLRRLREIQVDHARGLGPARHRGNQKGEFQTFPKQRNGGVNPTEIQLGKRLMHQTVSLEPGG